MSFTDNVIEELMEVGLAKTCCRKAMLCGLFFAATVEDGRRVRAEFRSRAVAELACEILQRQFSAQPEIIESARAGRRIYTVTATSKAVSAFLGSVDNNTPERRLFELVGFRCAECVYAFARGVFIATGSVNDPKKSYHLEIALPNEARAESLAALFTKDVAPPKTVKRGDRVGVYYKKNMMIADLLYYLGAVKSGFELSDTYIEHDIRNGENRATNCVARNISRAVETSMKHIEAIEELERTGKLLKLSEELRYTAALRRENPASSLSELAMLHEPPISKSGLNRRLTKILEELEN